MKRRTAFTLVELLVVIAIIALLMSILMPALGRARNQARAVICRASLKQWGIIWRLYTDENDSKLPDCTGFGALRGDWIIALRKHYPTGKITVCSNATKFVDYGDPSRDHGGVFSTYRNPKSDGTYEYCSYGMNCWSYSTTHWAMGTDGKEKIWKQLEVGASANTIPLFMDSAFRGSFPDYDGYDSMKMPNAEHQDNGFDRVFDGVRQFAMPRHKARSSKAGTNVLFFDLSARHVNVKEMWTLKWHRKFDTGEYLNRRNTIWPGTWMDKYVDP